MSKASKIPRGPEPEMECPTLPEQISPITPTLEEVMLKVAILERRLDLLYRWTVGDRTGYRYPVPNFALGRGDSHPGIFPDPDYAIQGGPRKPATEP